MRLSIGIVMYQSSNSKGQELVAQRMVKWFRKIGHDAYLITSIYHDGKEVIPQSQIEISVEGYRYLPDDPWSNVPTIRVNSYLVSWPPRRVMFKNFIDVLRKITSKFNLNVIITHSTLWNGPEEVSKFILWKRTMKMLDVDECDMIFAHMSHYQPPDPTRYSPVERAYRFAWNHLILPQIFKVADLILCVTPIEAEEMIKMGANPDQIFVFPGGIDDDEFIDFDEIDSSDFRAKYGIPENVKIIAYLGTIEERKNPLAIVRIAKKLRNRKDIHFVIAGKPGDQWDQVVKEAEGLDNVTITGELSKIDKVKLIKETYVNVIMSKMEALGLTQLEFMYGSVPVITSAVYGQKWLIRHGIDGIHVNGPDDIEGAVKAIEYLVDNIDERNRMGRNARERAQEFLLSNLIIKLASKLTELLRHKEAYS